MQEPEPRAANVDFFRKANEALKDLFDRARTDTIRVKAIEYPAVCSVRTGDGGHRAGGLARDRAEGGAAG